MSRSRLEEDGVDFGNMMGCQSCGQIFQNISGGDAPGPQYNCVVTVVVTIPLIKILATPLVVVFNLIGNRTLSFNFSGLLTLWEWHMRPLRIA